MNGRDDLKMSCAVLDGEVNERHARTGGSLGQGLMGEVSNALAVPALCLFLMVRSGESQGCNIRERRLCALGNGSILREGGSAIFSGVLSCSTTREVRLPVMITIE